MLFKLEHKEMILEGKKTATRRIWKKLRVKVDGIYKCKLKMLSKDYFAKIKVTRLYKQKLRDMMPEDAWKEGYDTLGDFRSIWIHINGEWYPDMEVDVIEFELMQECEFKDKEGYCDAELACNKQDMDDSGRHFCEDDNIQPSDMQGSE